MRCGGPREAATRSILAGSRPKPQASEVALLGYPPIPDVPPLGRTDWRRHVIVEFVAVAEGVGRAVQVEHRHIGDHLRVYGLEAPLRAGDGSGRLLRMLVLGQRRGLI